jgi:hypothetical protein
MSNRGNSGVFGEEVSEGRGKRPDFMNYIYVDGLKDVKPGAEKMIR